MESIVRKQPSQQVRTLIELFDRFGPRYARAVSQSFEGAQTTPSRLRLLGLLSQEGSLTMNALADALCIAPRSVTTLVDGLETEHMVERQAHPTDRRSTLIAATERGLQAFDDSREKHLDHLSRLFEVLTVEQLSALIEGHRVLIDAMDVSFSDEA